VELLVSDTCILEFDFFFNWRILCWHRSFCGGKRKQQEKRCKKFPFDVKTIHPETPHTKFSASKDFYQQPVTHDCSYPLLSLFFLLQDFACG
jgi:hypothetical protein